MSKEPTASEIAGELRDFHWEFSDWSYLNRAADLIESQQKTIDALVEALSQYDAALERREHGGVAANTLVWDVKKIVAALSQAQPKDKQ